MSPLATLSATDYGAHLRLVCAHAAASGLLRGHELELIRGLDSATDETASLIARALQRKRVPIAANSLEGDVDEAVRTGWLARVSGPDAAAAQTSWLNLPIFVDVAEQARVLVDVALLVCFASDEADLSWFVRHALGQVSAKPGTPLAMWLAGIPPRCEPAFATRPILDDYLEARTARMAGPSPALLERSLKEVEAAEGHALPLTLFHQTPLYHWTYALWECGETLPKLDARRPRIVRALRRAPLSPGLALRVWEEVHRTLLRPEQRRKLAAQMATWSICRSGDRKRWLARARRVRIHKSDDPWPTLHLEEWLARDRTGSVLVAGKQVEEHALLMLRSQGWNGIHAEGDFWLGFTRLVFHQAFSADVPSAWHAPLQSVPSDWGQWGFRQRRKALIAEQARRFVQDPLGTAQICFAHFDSPDDNGPECEAVEAVCRLLPPLFVADLLTRLLESPGEASGLPDLIAWRERSFSWWEVKSPNDQLSDRQRDWLAWLVSEGQRAGVMRIDARKPQQLSLFEKSHGRDVTSRS